MYLTHYLTACLDTYDRRKKSSSGVINSVKVRNPFPSICLSDYLFVQA